MWFSEQNKKTYSLISVNRNIEYIYLYCVEQDINRRLLTFSCNHFSKWVIKVITGNMNSTTFKCFIAAMLQNSVLQYSDMNALPISFWHSQSALITGKNIQIANKHSWSTKSFQESGQLYSYFGDFLNLSLQWDFSTARFPSQKYLKLIHHFQFWSNGVRFSHVWFLHIK